MANAERGRGSGSQSRQGAGSRAAENGGNSAAFIPEPSPSFVSSPYIDQLMERANKYLEIGYPVHFAGFPGTGKTTMALHLAAKRGRPAILMHGDEEFEGSDLVGREGGYAKSKLVDNYIRSVMRSEEKVRVNWSESALTIACREGYTFIYDEFNRSRPEANNVLLSVLEEGILSLPALYEKRGFVKVHPDFRAIFTSNPEEYAGTHRAADALLDRMITLNLNQYDRETEIAIAVKHELPRSDAERVVDIVRSMRSLDPDNRHPSVRASITIATILAKCGAHARADDELFRWACRDVINMEAGRVCLSSKDFSRDKLEQTIDRVCAGQEVDWSNLKSAAMPESLASGSLVSLLKQLRQDLDELRAVASGPMATNHSSGPATLNYNG